LSSGIIKDRALLNSSFYRVVHFLMKCKDQYDDTNNGSCDKSTLLSVTIDIVKTLDLDKRMVFTEQYSKEQIIPLYKGEEIKILKFDVTTLMDIYFNLIKSFKFKTVAKAVGLNFKSRGFGFSQKTKDLDSFENPSGCLISNHLNECWFKKSQYGSWCKIKLSKSIKKQSSCYGQLNYFFNLKIRNDKYVSSLKIASVTCRETEFPDFSVNYEDLRGKELYNEKLPLPYICLIKKETDGKGNTTSYNTTSYNTNLPLYVSLKKIQKTKVVSMGFVKKGMNEFIPIKCDDNGKLVDPQLFDYNYTDKGRGTFNPTVARVTDENFPIEMLAFIDSMPANLITPEDSKIFREINLIDKLDVTLDQYRV